MEKMSLKRVSVVLCTYNGEKYIREQLESIVSQTYPIHELLIQDDCSTDATPLIIEEYILLLDFIETRIIWASIEIFGRLSKK